MKKIIFLVVFIWFINFCHAGDSFPLGEENIRVKLKEMFHAGEFELLEEECNELLSFSNISQTFRFFLLSQKWSALHSMGKLEDALAISNEIIETDKPDSLNYWNIRAFIGMGDIFSDIGNYTMEREALDRAEIWLDKLDKVNSLKVRDALSQFYLAKSKLGYNNNDFTEAITQWKKAEKYSVNPSLYLAWLGQGAGIYEQIGDSTKADKYFLEVLNQKITNPNKIVALVHCMGYRNDRGRYAESLALLEKHIDLVKLGINPYIMRYLLLAKGDALAGIGESEKAFLYFKRSEIISDSLREVENRIRNVALAKRIDPIKYSALTKELNTTKNSWLFTLIILVIILIASVILGILFIKHKQIHKKEIKAYTDTARRHDEEREKLRRETDMTGRQLNATNLEVTRLYECLAEIRTETSRSDKNSSVSIPIIKSILHRAQTVRNERETFDHRLENINMDLQEKLTLLHPNLTRSELEMCYYIFEGITAKEVAMMTGRSIRTVETLKYKLRKKLGISESTEPYLRRIAAMNRDEISEYINKLESPALS